MKFLRLTSVFLCCALLSSFLALSASAVDDMDYYSLPPVGGSEPSLSVSYPVNPAEFDNNDSATLTNIYKIIQYLYLSPASWQSNSVIGFLENIYDRLPSNLGSNFALQGGDGTNAILDGIRGWVMQTYIYLSGDNIAGNLGNIKRNTGASADRLLSLVQAVSGINGFATESSLSKLVGTFSTPMYDVGPELADFGELFNSAFGAYSTWFFVPDSSSASGQKRVGFNAVLSAMGWGLTTDSINSYGGDYTLFHYVKNLSETLASEDDKQLSENYKENREQAERDFLSGKSGKTSLGKDDFHSLSSVGGTFKDTISLNGQSSLSDLTSGLSDADSAGQGWFSQATKDSLDAVSGSSETTVSTFSDDGSYSVDVDPDPYHMQGFEDNYGWLWGDD
jgi:hypothetical protein